jgi:phosphoribosylanthranilate isomerase
MNIKVCGITSIEQLIQLDKLMVDYAGLIFDKNSYQCIDGKLLESEIQESDLDIKKVGVFTNDTLENIMHQIEAFQLDLIQLNGFESPEFC